MNEMEKNVVLTRKCPIASSKQLSLRDYKWNYGQDSRCSSCSSCCFENQNELGKGPSCNVSAASTEQLEHLSSYSDCSGQQGSDTTTEKHPLHSKNLVKKDVVKDEDFTCLFKYCLEYPQLLSKIHHLLNIKNMANGEHCTNDYDVNKTTFETDLSTSIFDQSEPLDSITIDSNLDTVNVCHRRSWKRRYYTLLDTVNLVYLDYTLLCCLLQGKYTDYPMNPLCYHVSTKGLSHSYDNRIMLGSNPIRHLRWRLQTLLSSSKLGLSETEHECCHPHKLSKPDTPMSICFTQPSVQFLVSAAFTSDVVIQFQMQEANLNKRLLLRARLVHVLGQARQQITKLKEYVTAQRVSFGQLQLRLAKLEVERLQQNTLVTSVCQGTQKSDSVDSGANKVKTAASKAADAALRKAVLKRKHALQRQINKQKMRIVDLEVVLKEEECERRRLHNQLQRIGGNIRVFCRVRPPELSTSQVKPIECLHSVSDDKLFIDLSQPHLSLRRELSGKTQCKLRASPSVTTTPGVLGVGAKCFFFDRVFSPQASQDDVYSQMSDLIVSCVDGYNVCIIAYGQTGSGKTYTMMGSRENPGVNRRAVTHLLETCHDRRHWNYTLSMSMLEIYQDEVFDLLASSDKAPSITTTTGIPLSTGISAKQQTCPAGAVALSTIDSAGRNATDQQTTRKKVPKWVSANAKLLGPRTGGYSEIVSFWRDQRKAVRILSTANEDLLIENLTKRPISTEQDVLDCIELGEARRCVGASQLNITSSRSHLLMLLRVNGVNRIHAKSTRGTLILTDLAGSENVNKSGSVGQRFQEATCINKSLSCLGRVFDSLRRQQKPTFRETKLTYLLKPSLGGEAKCLLLVTLRGESEHVDETLRAITFGQAALQVSPGQKEVQLPDCTILQPSTSDESVVDETVSSTHEFSSNTVSVRSVKVRQNLLRRQNLHASLITTAHDRYPKWR